MNKKELAAEIAADMNITKADAELFIDSFTTTVTRVLATGEDVKLIGFGTFGTREKKARNGFNPYEKTHIQLPEKVYPYFKAGKILKDSI